MIALIAALPQEIHRLVRRYNLQRVHRNPSVYEDPEKELNCYVVVSGVGRICAADCCRYLYQSRPPEAMISIGYAGGLDPSIRVGDAVIAKEMRIWNGASASPDTSVRRSSARFVDEARKAAKNAALFIHAGITLQSDECLGTPEMKKAARNATGALSVDMESQAIADFAAERELPFLSVRFISDAAGDYLNVDPTALVDEEGIISMQRALKYFMQHPRLLPSALKLQAAVSRCEENLVRFIENFKPLHK